MQDHRKLRVWRKAQELCVEVYRASAPFPAAERYGLTAQIRKAAVSVGSNVAEASRRTSRKDKARIMNIAQCEGAEVMSELDVACRLGYVSRDTVDRLVCSYDALQGSLERLRQRIDAGHSTSIADDDE